MVHLLKSYITSKTKKVKFLLCSKLFTKHPSKIDLILKVKNKHKLIKIPKEQIQVPLKFYRFQITHYF